MSDVLSKGSVDGAIAPVGGAEGHVVLAAHGLLHHVDANVRHV